MSGWWSVLHTENTESKVVIVSIFIFIFYFLKEKKKTWAQCVCCKSALEPLWYVLWSSFKGLLWQPVHMLYTSRKSVCMTRKEQLDFFFFVSKNTATPLPPLLPYQWVWYQFPSLNSSLFCTLAPGFWNSCMPKTESTNITYFINKQSCWRQDFIKYWVDGHIVALLDVLLW